MDSGDSCQSTDAGLVTSGSVEKMKNRRKQQKLNQPKKVKVFKNAKKFKLNKKSKNNELNDELDDKLLTNKLADKLLTNKLTDKLTDKLTSKLNNKLNSLPDKSNEEITVKEVVAVAANLLLKSIANQTTHKSKCNLLTNKQIKLSKDKLADAKFNCPNSLTINHQPLIAMFGQNNEKLEESISLCLKDADCATDKFGQEKLNSDKFVNNCKSDDHSNCLNSNETHQIVISLLERLIDQQQNATNQLKQLNQLQTKQPNNSLRKRNNERRKKLNNNNKIKNGSNGQKMVKKSSEQKKISIFGIYFVTF